MTACNQHANSPVKGYSACPGCEVERLRAELAGLRTGFDAQNKLIATLNTENEKLLASKLYWVSPAGSGLVRCVPDDRYRKFSPSIRARYEPVRVVDAAMGKGGDPKSQQSPTIK